MSIIIITTPINNKKQTTIGENFRIMSFTTYPLSGKFISPVLASIAASLEISPIMATTKVIISITFKIEVDVFQDFQ